jgi:BlaI family penicillinase repressor
MREEHAHGGTEIGEKMMSQQISESELVLMKIIWKNGGSALYAQILEELQRESNPWNKNTVLTLLSRLIDKKYLKIRKIGRRNDYIALVTEQEYQTLQTNSFLNRVYSGNVRTLVSTLLRQDVLSAAEMQEVENYWTSLNQSLETGDPAGSDSTD